MQSKRATFLAGILVFLVLGFVSKPLWIPYVESQANSAPSGPIAVPPLPGENSIDTPVITRNEQGQWVVSFDYFYTGAPSGAVVRINFLRNQGNLDTPIPEGQWIEAAKKGRHRASRILVRPGAQNEAFTSTGIKTSLVKYSSSPPYAPVDLVVKTIALEINWPDFQTYSLLEQLRTETPAEYLKTAVELIDEGERAGLSQARRRLDYLLQKDPQFHPAYLELARVAMKTNWGPEGLRQAETYIDAARKLASDDPNVWILQAYVYTYQGRYKEAEPLLIAASKTDTPNLWLWTNWGEFHLLQSRIPQAIEMFRKAVDQPPPRNTYDRARVHAYWQLFKILEKKDQLDLAETLYQKRYSDYSSIACYGAEFAHFMLMKRGNIARATELANQPSLATCKDPNPKEVLGLAHYASWAEAPVTERSELLNRARVVFPPGTRLTYQLASSDHTLKALKALQSTGELIDQMDNRKMTALAYALSNKDYDTARRLLRLQAHTNLMIGQTDIPLALIPVIAEDYPGIKLLRQFGVDYSKIKYQDMTAIDHAKRIGNRKLLEAVGGQQGQQL